MRTINQLPVPQESDLQLYPGGTIRNETATQKGTPVVREVYGDVLQNIYAILRHSGVTANGEEDNTQTGYQLLEAFKKFHNELNDLRQTITLDQNDWSANLDIDSLPEDYVFIGKITEDFSSSESYTFRGSGQRVIPVSASVDIPASSSVIVVLNSSGVEFIQIEAGSQSSTSAENIKTPFGSPLSFNNSNKLLYLSDGFILSNYPESFNIQQAIRNETGNPQILVEDAVCQKNHIIALCFDSNAIAYSFFAMPLSNINSVVEVDYIPDFGDGDDKSPYMFADDQFLYLTNSANLSDNDYEIRKLVFEPTNYEISNSSLINLDQSFEKTTNGFFTGDNLFTFSGGYLYSFSLQDQSKNLIGFFNGVNGTVFKFKGTTYFSTGDSASKWNY
tara:strand:- start:3796 stop:4965 length:1170 start_codon:yes stop_codon:yes gene_type:complete